MFLTTAECNCETICNCPLHVSSLPRLHTSLPSKIAKLKAEFALTPRKQRQNLAAEIARAEQLLVNVKAALVQVRQAVAA